MSDYPILSLGKFENTSLDWAEVLEFLEESNAIESEYSQIAMDDAVRAWNYAINPSEDIDGNSIIDLDLVLGIHACLMRRLNQPIAGKLRDCDVWVGGRKCPFISEALIRDDLKKWIIVHGGANNKESIKIAHIAFEHLHPFADGNGRVGRLLKAQQELRANLPMQIIHTGDEQFDYYKWFK